MKCKKCKKEIDSDSVFCKWCGSAQNKERKKRMYQRPDGLFEKAVVIQGKRVTFRGKTEKEVEKKMLEYQGQQESGPKFSELSEKWKEEHFPTLSHNTLRGYKPAYARAVEYFGDKYVREIKQNDIKMYVASFPKTWALKTYKNYLLVINLIFVYAASNGIIENNPVEYVQIPKGLKRSHRRAPTEDEIKIIQNSINAPMGLFAYFILYTGCRRGEVLALQYKDIDRKNKLIHITKSVYHEGNKPKIKEPKTESGKRDIVLLDVLEKELPTGKANDFIFGENGSPLTSSRSRDLWFAYQEATGTGLTPHIVRHGYASMLHEAGIDPKDAQEMLGHAQISTTLDIYTHITEKQRAKTAEKLNKFLNSTQYNE